MKPIMMTVDLTTGTSQITPVDELFDTYLGGTGAATKLLTDEIALNKDPYAPPSPVFFAIGPFNGLYPLCTKTVALFISPLTGNLGESHAGGNLAMALFQAGIHILKITGRSAFPCYVRIVNHEVSIHRAYSLKGMSALASERVLRERIGNTWKSSIMRVGPAGERESPIACVTVDTSRHFGRLGLGGVFGNKNLKAVIVSGNGGIELGSNKGRYLKFYKNLYDQFVHSPALSKYHDLGTSMNILPLSRINGLPTRNFSQGFFEGAASISGERFADQSPYEIYATLLDEGTYLCSIRTMYRILQVHAEVCERRDQLRHPHYRKPELLATAPNQLWSWDITKLFGPVKWTYFYLYVVLDVFSRAIVGWLASIVMKTNAQMGLIANVLVGVAGSMLGFWIAGMLGIAASGGILRFVIALGGAMLLIFILGKLGIFRKT